MLESHEGSFTATATTNRPSTAEPARRSRESGSWAPSSSNWS